MTDLRQQLSQLSESQRADLAAQLDQLALTGSTADSLLFAYIVCEQDVAVDTAAMRTALASRLPEYMIPSQIIALESMPLTPNGKLDRAALAAYTAQPDPSTTTDAYVPPGSETEQAIAEIWSTLLGFDEIGIHDNFFELGGHSLLVTRAIAALRKRFQLDISVTTFFEHSSVAQLASIVEALQRAASTPPLDEGDDREDFVF